MTTDIKALMERKEELLPELRPYLDVGRAMGGPMLKHPLWFSVPYDPQMNAYINEGFRRKQAAVDKAIETKEYVHVIWLHERPYRSEAFMVLASKFTDQEYWKYLRSVWEDSENLWQHKRTWARLLQSPRPGRHLMMTEHERSIVETFPETVQVYRGCRPENRRGWSWTLLEDKARFFATRFRQKGGLVRSGDVEKSQIIAFLDGRGEGEVIVDPRHIRNIVENREKP